MSKKDWLKKLNLSKVKDLEFENVTEQKSSSVNENDAKEGISLETNKWTPEKESKLKSLTEEVNLKTNRLKEIEDTLKKYSPNRTRVEGRSFESSFIDREFKELAIDLFKSKKLGEIYECTVTGRGDYLIFKLDVKTKGIFSSRKRTESEVTSRDGELIIKNHSLIGSGKSKKTDFFRKELENFLEKLKTDIQNQEANYIDEVKIEKGILQVKFGLGENNTNPDEKKLEELEQEKQAIELLLREKNKLKDALLDEKLVTSNNASREKPRKEFSIEESMAIPLVAKIEGHIWRCQTEEELKILSEKIKEKEKDLSEDEKIIWKDILPVLNLSKKEMLGVISLWKDWSRNKENSELQKWSQSCIDILGKAINNMTEEEKSGSILSENKNNYVKENEVNILDETPTSSDSEYIPIKYDTEKRDISISNREGLKNKIEENLKEKLEIRRILVKKITISLIDDGYNVLVKLEEDNAERKEILAEFNLVNEENKISVEEIAQEKNGKLANLLVKEVKSEIKKAINEIKKSAEKKEGKEAQAIRIKGEAFEIIFEK